jgi:hypothetical protein
MVCENSVVLRAFGSKREAVNGGVRKLYNGEFLSMFSTSKIVKSNKIKISVKFWRNA